MATGAWPFASLLNFSIPQVLTGVLLSAILWTDTLLLGRYRSAADVGVYTIVRNAARAGDHCFDLDRSDVRAAGVDQGRTR